MAMVLLASLVTGAAVVGVIAVLLAILRAPSSRVSVKGRHVLITGGSSGIGLELAKLLASRGASKITLLARKVEALEKAVEDVRSCGGSTLQVEYLSADVVDYNGLQEAIHSAGSIDILVCSHGLSVPRAFEDASVDELHKLVDINFKGTINVIKAALPGLKRNGGAYARCIAIFSSQAGQVGMYGLAVYSGAKAALRYLGESLRQELQHDRIQVTIVYPPDTNTPGFEQENSTKPEITKILSASSAAMEAVDVAEEALRGITAGMLNVPCNFDGFLLNISTAGMSPQTSALYAGTEIALASLVRVIGLCVQYGWSLKLAKWFKKQ